MKRYPSAQFDGAFGNRFLMELDPFTNQIINNKYTKTTIPLDS